MKMEILPRNEGFGVLFYETSLATVAKIKRFSVASLSGMGYQLKVSKIEEGDDFFFFDLVSSTDRERLLKDLFYSLDKATRELIKEERP